MNSHVSSPLRRRLFPSLNFAAVQALPEQQRKVVVLRHWLGLSVAETAEELGISEGTVKSHSSRGLAALQRTLTTSD